MWSLAFWHRGKLRAPTDGLKGDSRIPMIGIIPTSTTMGSTIPYTCQGSKLLMLRFFNPTTRLMTIPAVGKQWEFRRRSLRTVSMSHGTCPFHWWGGHDQTMWNRNCKLYKIDFQKWKRKWMPRKCHAIDSFNPQGECWSLRCCFKILRYFLYRRSGEISSKGGNVVHGVWTGISNGRSRKPFGPIFWI